MPYQQPCHDRSVVVATREEKVRGKEDGIKRVFGSMGD
jgi:hypothetical protein